MKLKIVACAFALAVATPVLASGPQEVRCLAETVYHEARGESLDGQLAVAETVMNRVRAPSFPRTICGVVTQKGQFAPQKRIVEKAAFERALHVAQLAVDGRTGGVSGGATYFHTTKVSPSWSHRFTRTKKIGNHIFYRE